VSGEGTQLVDPSAWRAVSRREGDRLPPLQAQPVGARFPVQPLLHLDALWIQVAGTLCNLKCSHCFVSAGPGDQRHALMPRDEVRRRVIEALPLGVKEFYFTGGEPFVHPELLEILADTLEQGPCTVLTNGTLLTRRRLERLRELSDRSRYTLEIRVSLDGSRAEDHDRLRGAGSFGRALAGLRGCAAHGLLPVVSITQTSTMDPRPSAIEMLRRAGLPRPRIKVLPMFRLGREAGRSGASPRAETLADLPDHQFDATRLQCGSCRAVTSRGVFVCPLLVDEPGARMGDRLEQSLGGFALRHGACYTCYVTGMTCANG
jgi:sulfatase maturation enzyme AslB (radical SAM superfamily)